MTVKGQAQTALSQVLLEHIRRDSYPSTTQMMILEETIPRAMVPEYLNILLEKTWHDQSPSIPMLRRISRIARELRY